MWMDDDADESEFCQLEFRHWVITDEEGHEETVEGPGVVGQSTNYHTTLLPHEF